MKNIVVLTGAGISAESGISTFRDAGGLWENHRIEDVASPDGWHRNKALVLHFYNIRRQQLLTVKPNAAHLALADLEKKHKVTIITQNVDDLHERAGSTNVIHLHGELLKARSTADESLIYDWKKDIALADKCEKGSQLRPHIVWFGEQVPMIAIASKIVEQTDVLIIVGTSLQVYPAASLMYHCNKNIPKYFVNLDDTTITDLENLKIYREKASTGVAKVVAEISQE